MNWRVIGTVLLKELRETLRDRRTLFIMIVIPVLLYPAMLILMEQITLFGQRSLEATTPRVAVVGEANGAREFLERGGALVLVYYDTVPHGALETGRVDAIVVFPAQAAWQARETNRVQLFYDGTQDRSSYARGMVERRLHEWGDSLLVQRLTEQGLPREYAVPVALEESSIAGARQMGGYLLGRFLPLLLILMTVLGCFYPSIDLAAGEKERGTLETLLTAPVPADQIVTGKFVAAGIMGFIAASLNLLSMLLTFQSGILSFGGALELQFSLPLHAVLVIFAVLLLLSVLFSAMFLGIAVRSHSFKEAQNSLTPVYILSFLPALLAMMPGMSFTPAMAMVPVAGVAFLFRDLMTGTVELEPAIIAVASTVLYAMVALIFAARAFGREDVLFGTSGGDVDGSPWRARLRRWRRAPRGLPRPGEAVMLVVFIALLFFYLGRALLIGLGETGILASQLLLLALPVLAFCVVGRYDLRATLALRAAPPRAFGAALLIILGGIPIGWTIAWLQGFVLEIPVEYLRALEQLITAADLQRLLWLLLVVALTPAICEELVFRGVLLQSLGRSASMWKAVLFSALVFGAFHLSFETAIRFLPTAFLGLLLGYVVWHTRSLYTGMLMHLVNNAMVVVLVSTPALRERFADLSGQPPWLIVALAPFLLWAGLRLLPRREESEPAPGPLPAPDTPPEPARVGTEPAGIR
jgi:sodium transport system permease protein